MFSIAVGCCHHCQLLSAVYVHKEVTRQHATHVQLYSVLGAIDVAHRAVSCAYSRPQGTNSTGNAACAAQCKCNTVFSPAKESLCHPITGHYSNRGLDTANSMLYYNASVMCVCVCVCRRIPSCHMACRKTCPTTCATRQSI